jgi:hypothetical protein
MSTVAEKSPHLSPLTESVLYNLQYTLGLLDRANIQDSIFTRATRNLFASLSAQLAVESPFHIHSRDRRVYINENPVPDSYILQRIFIRNKCPGVQFKKGLQPEGLARCLRDIGRVLGKELDPSLLCGRSDPDGHYEWQGLPPTVSLQ